MKNASTNKRLLILNGKRRLLRCPMIPQIERVTFRVLGHVASSEFTVGFSDNLQILHLTCTVIRIELNWVYRIQRHANIYQFLTIHH